MVAPFQVYAPLCLLPPVSMGHCSWHRSLNQCLHRWNHNPIPTSVVQVKVGSHLLEVEHAIKQGGKHFDKNAPPQLRQATQKHTGSRLASFCFGTACGTIRYGMVPCGTARHGTVRYCIGRYSINVRGMFFLSVGTERRHRWPVRSSQSAVSVDGMTPLHRYQAVGTKDTENLGHAAALNGKRRVWVHGR